MTKALEYELRITLTSAEEIALKDERFVRCSRQLLADVRLHLKRRDAKIAYNVDAKTPDEYEWVDQIVVRTQHPEIALGAVQFVARRIDTTVVEVGFGFYGDTSKDSLYAARWLRIEGDWHDPEFGSRGVHSPNRFEIDCNICGWPNLSRLIGGSYQLDKMTMKKSARDVYIAGRGFLIVTPRVFDVIHDFASSEILHGEAVVTGQERDTREFVWIRPKYVVGCYYSTDRRPPVCAGCDRPKGYVLADPPAELPVRGELIRSFSGKCKHLGLIDEIPIYTDLKKATAGAMRHWMAMSGELYRNLTSNGFRGIRAPYGGPLLAMHELDKTWCTRKNRVGNDAEQKSRASNAS